MIKNLTKRPIRIKVGDNLKIYWPDENNGPASVQSITTPVGTVDEVPVTKTSFGEITGLPKERDGVVYIVSAITARAARELGRVDCFVPNEAVMGDDGEVLHYKSLGIV